MRIKLKPLAEQTIVITGASSGIGRATALMAAGDGARVVAVARNEPALQQLVSEITAGGGRAVHAVADVADPDAVDGVARVAVEVFGGFDTWINNAGVGLYGRLDEVHLAEKRRVFDVVFWGVVHGCRSALPHLRSRGGAIVNIGSSESDVPRPLTGIYAAAKHAVKAYTETLRMELEHDGIPVSVTLVKPSGIDTPFFRHARSHLAGEAKAVPPVYDPDVAASAILHAASHVVPEISVGATTPILASAHAVAPRITERYMERRYFDTQVADRPVPPADALFDAVDEPGSARGDYPGHVRRRSLYTRARLHPLRATAMFAGVGLAVMAGARTLAGRGD